MNLFKKTKLRKYKKCRKNKLKNLEFKATNLRFGILGLKSVESGIITSNQLLSAKQTILKKIKKKNKIWVNIFPNISVTSKPIGIRMGKGKGQVSNLICRVSCGTVLFELCGLNNLNLFEALKVGGSKLPIKTKIFN